MLLVSSIFGRWFSAFSWLISRFYSRIRRNLAVGSHFRYCCLQLRPCFWLTFRVLLFTDISKCFSCLSNCFSLFQECSVVNTLWVIACLGLFPSGGKVSTTRWRIGKTMVEVFHPGEFRFIWNSQEQLWLLDSQPFGDDSLWPRWWHPLHSVVSVIIGGERVRGITQVPRSRSSHGLIPNGRGSIIQPPPDPKPVIWLVSMGFRLWPRTLRLRF